MIKMNQQELLDWYWEICQAELDCLDEFPDLFVTPYYFWAEELYREMDADTKKECSGEYPDKWQESCSGSNWCMSALCERCKDMGQQ